MTKAIIKINVLIYTLLLSEKAFAACTTGQACIGKPEGILSTNEKTEGIANLISWILLSASLAGCIIFGIRASKKLSESDFVGALGPGLGSLVSGAIAFIAHTVTTA